jgi:hypothetical protein
VLGGVDVGEGSMPAAWSLGSRPTYLTALTPRSSVRGFARGPKLNVIHTYN